MNKSSFITQTGLDLIGMFFGPWTSDTLCFAASLFGYLVEELEQFGAGLVDGADYGSSSLSQSFEQRHHLETGRAVQTTETETDGSF